MKSQPAIEFLTTYSFMFLIIGLTIVVVTFIVLTSKASIPQQCTTYGGLTCQNVIYYSNAMQSNAIIYLSFINSQSVPVNVINITVTINNQTAVGSCSPLFLFPSNKTSCNVRYPSVLPLGTFVGGTFIINLQYCNSPVSQLAKSTCNYDKIAYVGSFSAYASLITTV